MDRGSNGYLLRSLYSELSGLVVYRADAGVHIFLLSEDTSNGDGIPTRDSIGKLLIELLDASVIRGTKLV